MSELFGPGWGNYSIKGIVELELPAEISLMPETWGWTLVGALILLWTLYQMAKLLRHKWLNRYRQVGIQQLQVIKADYQAGDLLALRKLPVLIKSVALQAFTRDEVAHLTGEHWEAFLESSDSGPKFSESEKGLLHCLAYQPFEEPIELPETYWQRLKLWIETHRGQHG